MTNTVISRYWYRRSFVSGDFLQRTASGSYYQDSWPSLFIAPAGIRSDLHVDAFGSNFWMALFQGRKRYYITCVVYFMSSVNKCILKNYTLFAWFKLVTFLWISQNSTKLRDVASTWCSISKPTSFHMISTKWVTMSVAILSIYIQQHWSVTCELLPLNYPN